MKINSNEIFPISDLKLSTNVPKKVRKLAIFFGAKEVIETSIIKPALKFDEPVEFSSISLNREIVRRQSFDQKISRPDHKFTVENDFKQLREVYIQRIKSQVLFKNSNEERKELNKVYNFEESMQNGIK